MCWAGPQLLVVVFVLLSSPLAAQDDGRSKADANQTTLSSVKLGVYLPGKRCALCVADVLDDDKHMVLEASYAIMRAEGPCFCRADTDNQLIYEYKGGYDGKSLRFLC